jgi:hypothetical protein
MSGMQDQRLGEAKRPTSMLLKSSNDLGWSTSFAEVIYSCKVPSAKSLKSGAPRSMKMGTIRSPSRYDPGARVALQPPKLRQHAIRQYVSRCQPHVGDDQGGRRRRAITCDRSRPFGSGNRTARQGSVIGSANCATERDVLMCRRTVCERRLHGVSQKSDAVLTRSRLSPGMHRFLRSSDIPRQRIASGSRRRR